MIIKLKPITNPRHTKVTFFMGEDEDHLQNCGVLVLDTGLDEWTQFMKILRLGCEVTGDKFTMEETQSEPLASILYHEEPGEGELH